MGMKIKQTHRAMIAAIDYYRMRQESKAILLATREAKNRMDHEIKRILGTESLAGINDRSTIAGGVELSRSPKRGKKCQYLKK